MRPKLAYFDSQAGLKVMIYNLSSCTVIACSSALSGPKKAIPVLWEWYSKSLIYL